MAEDQPTGADFDAAGDALLRELDVRSPTYKRAWVDAALAHGEALAPRLVAYLEQVVADPETFDRTRGAALGPLYALAVLTHTREARAHDVAADLAGLPPDVLDRLLGTYVVAGLPGALAATSGGRTDRLEALVADAAVDEFARGAAMQALAFLVHLGQADREAVLRVLAARLAPEAGPSATYEAAIAVTAMVDLHAVEYRDALGAAFEAGRVDESIVDLEDAEALLAAGPEAAAGRLAADLARELPADPHALLEGLYDLPALPPPHRDRDEAPPRSAPAAPRRAAPPRPAPKVDPAKAKARRKAAKAARRQQRKGRK